MTVARGFYLHLPFCLRKCRYCDFTVRVLQKRTQITRYLEALEHELKALGQIPQTLETLYLGGGTPSLLNQSELSLLITALRQHLDLSHIQEWTLEVNPETGSKAYFEFCRAQGINRISLGIQSFSPAELEACGRSHRPEDIQTCLQALRESGFENISFDLIFGLPGQSLASWQNTLEQALQHRPSHLSLYGLEVHAGTEFGWLEQKQRLSRPHEDEEVAMYQWACERLQQAGYDHYEIANWALPGKASQHNQLYWLAAPVLAAGVGAHGYWQNRRYANSEDLLHYYAQIENGHWAWEHTPVQSLQEAAAERIMLGLRLLQTGLDAQRFEADFGLPLTQASPELLALQAEGRLFCEQGHWKLAPESVMLSNEIFAQLLEPRL